MKPNPMPLNILKEGILYAMKENLMIQYILPEYELPATYKELMNSVDYHIITPINSEDKDAFEVADAIIFDNWNSLLNCALEWNKNYVLRTSKGDFFNNYSWLNIAMKTAGRINVVFTDIDTFIDADFNLYDKALKGLIEILAREYSKGRFVQLNLITDRILLKEMNNCNAGVGNITLAPDGKFYICPGFYYDGTCNGDEVSLGEVCRKGFSVGSLSEGLNINNAQLFKLDYAPLCRTCDAYQCARCVWLNRKTTFEVNTPSHEQCVMAHLERNASRKFLEKIRESHEYFPDCEIKEISYLDPFDVKKEW